MGKCICFIFIFKGPNFLKLFQTLKVWLGFCGILFSMEIRFEQILWTSGICLKEKTTQLNHWFTVSNVANWWRRKFLLCYVTIVYQSPWAGILRKKNIRNHQGCGRIAALNSYLARLSVLRVFGKIMCSTLVLCFAFHPHMPMMGNFLMSCWGPVV